MAMTAKKIRVMHVVLSMGNGGLENVVLNLCRYIDQRQIEQSVCCLEAEGPLVPFLQDMGVPHYYMGKKPGVSLSLPFRLAALFRRAKIDVVHTHDAGANFYGGPAGLLAGVKGLLKTEHGGINLATPNILKVDTWLCNHMSRVVTVSEYLKKQSVLRGVEPQKITVVPNGIDLKKYQPPQDVLALRAQWGFAPEDKIIYTVGRFVPLKNIQLLIKVAPAIIAEFPNVKFAIVGFGPLQAELEQMVGERRLQEKVKFLGNRTDLPQLLPMMDIFVLCSKLEGLGLVILEAMAAGKPVIASNIGGIPEIVKHGSNGLLFPSDDEAALIAALRRLIQNPEMSRQLAAAGSETVKNFTLQKMATTYQNIYRYHAYRCSALTGARRYWSNQGRQFCKQSALYFYYYSGLFLWQRRQGTKLRVVTYHRVVNEADLDYLPVGLAVTQKTLDKHLEVYKRFFHLIDPSELLKHKDDLNALPPNSLFITFDDGYLDNYELALPLLRKHGIGGIVFLTTNYLENPQMFWTDTLAYLIKALQADQYPVEKALGNLPPELIYNFSLIYGRQGQLLAKPYNELMDYLKHHPETKNIIRLLQENTSLFKEELLKKYRMLNWEQLREMSQANFISGAHTLSHPDLTAINPEQLEKELVGAKALIEEKLGQSVLFLTYPYGYYNDKVITAAKRAGYQIAFSLEQGDNQSPFSLYRVNVWENSFRGFRGRISPPLMKVELSRTPGKRN